MTEGIDEFFTPKHKQLTQFSTIANIIAWIVLVVYILEAFMQFLKLTRYQGIQSIPATFQEYPETSINFLLIILGILLRGVVYWFTLKGISLGLKMIVETDLNYREKSQGESNE